MSEGRDPIESGFSLIEVIVATVIAVIAILGLAHSFGIGRAFINRFEAERSALALAQARMEVLTKLPLTAAELGEGSHSAAPPEILPGLVGSDAWVVDRVDDPADGLGASDSDPFDYKRVTVTIAWTQGGIPEVVQLSRQFLKS
jgi:prepilin-type N-terminal cleavage/methylation domain-containing protein